MTMKLILYGHTKFHCGNVPLSGATEWAKDLRFLQYY